MRLIAMMVLVLAVAGCDDSEPSATGAYTPAKPESCEKASPVNPCV